MSCSVLVATASLGPGGAERVVAELTRRWAISGWRVGVVTLADASSDHYVLEPHVERTALGLTGPSVGSLEAVGRNWQRIRALRRIIRSFRPDVVLSLVDQINVCALAAASGLRVPVVVSERIDPCRHDIGLMWRAGRRLLYPRASALVVQTRAVASWAERVVPKDKVHVIPNFVPTLRAPSGTARERFILGVGRLTAQKGFDTLLEAYARSGAGERGYHLVILGEGPERGALTALAERLGIQDRLEMPGVVTEPEEWMERAAVFVLPSRYEGFPNALLEAMAMGCPVIAANCDSGPREIVRDGENGLLFPQENPGALTSLLDRMLTDVALRESFGREALKVRERFALTEIARRWVEVIEGAIRR